MGNAMSPVFVHLPELTLDGRTCYLQREGAAARIPVGGQPCATGRACHAIGRNHALLCLLLVYPQTIYCRY